MKALLLSFADLSHISRAFATNKEGAAYFDVRKRSRHARRGLKISKRAQQQQIVVCKGTKAHGSAEGKGGFPRGRRPLRSNNL